VTFIGPQCRKQWHTHVFRRNVFLLFFYYSVRLLFSLWLCLCMYSAALGILNNDGKSFSSGVSIFHLLFDFPSLIFVFPPFHSLLFLSFPSLHSLVFVDVSFLVGPDRTRPRKAFWSNLRQKHRKMTHLTGFVRHKTIKQKNKHFTVRLLLLHVCYWMICTSDKSLAKIYQ